MDKDRTDKIDDKNTIDKEKTRARKKALVLLTDMDRTEMQLLEKLRKAGFSEAAVQDAIEYVRGFGYINDERYARHYVEVVRNRKSLLRIEHDLRTKGIDISILDRVMEEAREESEMALILRMAEKKMKGKDPTDRRDRDKVCAYLSRQGFKSSEIRRAMDILTGES